ncbi:tetratricopeptide repeat protein [Flavobacteriaceae bacterium S0862]|nr:tetratricopeptide repeat protein [Flavobacteriaceae bacterium S0862]
MSLKHYYNELKRRNVIKSALAYIVVSWVIIQVMSIILPTIEAPAFVMKLLLVVILIGFPLWIVFAWVYEITTDGIKKTININLDESITPVTNNRLNKIIIISLVVAIVLLSINLFIGNNFIGISNSKDRIDVISIDDKSIAVLAFTDMSQDKDQEYFSDGISEEILNLLAKITDLKVISRTSSFSFKNKEVTASEIGRALNVNHVLEGSIRKSDNTFRITAQLIDVTNGSNIWSETYDRPMIDIFKIQDEIASNVSEQLQLRILGELKVTKSPKVEAYNLYLKAHHLANQNTKASYITAEKVIKEALEIDPNYSDALRLLASIYHTGMYNFSLRSYEEGIPLGMEAAQKSVDLDPYSGDNYMTLASFQELNWDFEASAKSTEKALELDSYSAVILGTAANMTFGDINKSVELLKRAIIIDPLVYVNFYNLGFAYYKLGEIEKAEEAFETFFSYYPNSQIIHYMMAQVRIAQGRYDEALKEIEQETHEFFSLYGLNFVYHALGDTKRSNELFEEFKEKYSEGDPANLADLYAFRGNKDASFKWLGKALEIKDPVLLEALAYPSFKILHGDSRWNEFINRLSLPVDHGFHLD